MLRRALPFDTCVAVEVVRAVGLHGLVGCSYRVRWVVRVCGEIRLGIARFFGLGTPHLLQIQTVYCPPFPARISGH